MVVLQQRSQRAMRLDSVRLSRRTTELSDRRAELKFMMTPEELSELQNAVAKSQDEAPVRSSELVSLRRQLDQATKIADTIDHALGIQPEESTDAISRLSHQIAGLVGALKDAKSKQANSRINPQK